MSLALYMDVHAPRAITYSLIAAGIDVITAQQDGCARMTDPELLDRANSQVASCSPGMTIFLSRPSEDNALQFHSRV
jgi:hypothetical protein